MVGVTGFEPATPCSQSTYATRLRYTPTTACTSQATLDIIPISPAAVKPSPGKKLAKSPQDSSRYAPAIKAAVAPSAAAVTTCLSGFLRQSPAANTPGTDVRVSSPARM